MTELEGLIRFWESILKSTDCLLDPSVRTHIENTIKHLRSIRDAGSNR